MSGELKLTPAQQASAVDRIGETLALRSGAGCGKTYVLARRFTELLLGGADVDNPLARFVALTFTDKAAVEMRQRIRRFLADRAAESADKADRKRLLGWLEQVGEARISTIHSFCASLLRAHAIEAKIDPSFTVCADTLATDQFVDEAAEAALLGAIEAQRDDVAELLGRISYETLTGLIRKLIGSRTDCVLAAFTDAAVIERRWGELLAHEREAAAATLANDRDLREKIDAIGNVPCSDGDDKLAVFRDEMLGKIRSILDSDDARTAETFASLNQTPGTKGLARNWGSAEIAKDVRGKIKRLCEAVAGYADYFEHLDELDTVAAHSLATLAGLALEANDIYALRKRRMGMLDFTDLLYHTRELLAGNAQVRRDISSRIDQMLIDECQDTSAFQLAMLLSLLFGDDELEDWPEGKLFLVGDGKQSIYRFRGAQVEVFEDLCRQLGEDKQENLDLSFRTHAGGTAFVNRLFTPLMGEDYSPIRPHRLTAPDHPSVEIILADGGEDNPIADATTAVKAQAAVTAQRIAEMLQHTQRLVWDDKDKTWRAVRPRDIAILLARMTNSLDFERELANRNIPYYVTAGVGFFKQQEVYDVLNALAAIDNPFDDIAFFGLLRSSIVGLDDNALMHVAVSCGEAPYLPKLFDRLERDSQAPPAISVAGLDAADCHILARTVELLRTLHRQKDAVGIDVLIERILDVSGYEATLLSQFQGRRMAGNVRRLVELARQASGSSLALADFLAQMSRRVMDQSRFEQAAVVGEEEDVVRIMTIHKAKGLEFPVVILPDLNARRNLVNDPLLNRLDWGLVLNLKGNDRNAEKPLSYRIVRRKEQADQQAEDIRQLYVAATRHMDHLVFVGANWRESGKKTDAARFKMKGSYLDQIDEVLGLRDVLDAGGDGIRYGESYTAAVCKMQPTPPTRRRPKTTPGEKILASARSGEDVAKAILDAAKQPDGPALLGPLADDVGRVEIAVTSLGDFQRCPMLYRWQYELRVGNIEPSPGKQDKARQVASPPAPQETDPATKGTFFHRCMELLDFAKAPSAAELAGQVFAEMAMEDAPDRQAVTAELGRMLERFRTGKLWAALADAGQLYRELDFVMDLDRVTLRGQIDAIYLDGDGRWHIVDYKSDRLGDEDIAGHAERYELQMMLYAAAATRHLGAPPADATLYFLRPGLAHAFTITPHTIETAISRAEETAGQIISARRTGRFGRHRSTACGFCRYKTLCEE